jgi:transcriptional regulator of met regulon
MISTNSEINCEAIWQDNTYRTLELSDIRLKVSEFLIKAYIHVFSYNDLPPGTL